MDIYNLALDEAIILQSSNVTRDGYDECEFEDEELHEIVLTNKKIIYIASDIDTENDNIIEVPLSAIKVINGNVQVKEFLHELYGRCLQVQFKHGVEYWRFDRKSKVLIPQWTDALITATEDFLATEPMKATSETASHKTDVTISDGDDSFASESSTTDFSDRKICDSCGAVLNEGIKFCYECGAAVKQETKKITERETVYEGNIHKCPSCGEIVKSFEIKCPSCGHEFREATTSGTVKEFERKLEDIERTRTSSDSKRKKRTNDDYEISVADQKKATLIRNFAIPNTKEDLFEFLVLASSNINMRRYYNGLDELSKSEEAVSDAWEAKFEQAFEKAKISFGNTPEFKEIQRIYDKKHKQIKKSKTKTKYFWIGYAIIFLLITLGPITIIFSSQNWEIKAENKRLNAILEEVYDAIEDENYVLARAKAASLTFSGPDNNKTAIAQEKWDKTREELLDIIDKSEYGSDYVAPKNTTTNSTTEKLQFAYLNSEWDLYVASEQKDGLIKIEKWRKGSSSDLKFVYDYDLGLFNVNDSDCGFSWIDDEKMAFAITLKDSKNMRLMKKTEVVFIANDDGNKFTGSHYSNDIASYSFENDDWYMYRAILLNETSIKIEVWDRGSSDSSFKYARDLCVFNLNDSKYNLQWSSDAHTAFSITLKDTKNLYWGKEQRVLFTLENENYTSKDLYAHFYGEN